MVSLRSILAAGCLSTIVYGAPVPVTLKQLFARSAYITYGGTGLVSEGWPAQSSWVSFDAMWTANQGVLTSGCGWSSDQLPENSQSELDEMKSAIQSVSASSGVDSRFILAIVLQESNGCVRVHSTANGVGNPGLMQSHNGAGSCNTGSDKQDPCPESEIVQMIKDGTEGTADGDGLVQCLQKSGATDDSKFYKASRIYNSGSIAAGGNLGNGNGATACYSSDIANRLMGYVGNTGCDAGTVASLTKTAGSTGGSTDTTPVASTPATSEPAATTPGGVFAEIPSSTAAASPTTETTAPVAAAPSETAPVTEEPEPVASTPTPATTESASPVSNPAQLTATVIPVPAASTTSAPEASTPEPEPTTTTPVSEPEPEASSTPAGLQTPGTACPVEGTWNCITSTSFQQCASGVWSVSQSLSAGLQCKIGMSKVFSVSTLNKA